MGDKLSLQIKDLRNLCTDDTIIMTAHIHEGKANEDEPLFPMLPELGEDIFDMILIDQSDYLVRGLIYLDRRMVI